METISSYIPKPSKDDYKKFSGLDLEAEMVSALRSDLQQMRDKKGLPISDDHIQAEVALQFVEQMKNDRPNVVVAIEATTEDVVSPYEGLSREFIIVMLEHEKRKVKFPTYSEMARDNPFF